MGSYDFLTNWDAEITFHLNTQLLFKVGDPELIMVIMENNSYLRPSTYKSYFNRV